MPIVGVCGPCGTCDVTVPAAVVEEQQSSGTNGGTFTAGSWATRVLNTEVADPDGIVSLASNVFTLEAGTYLIRWSAPAFRVDNHQSRLYNVTLGAAVGYGQGSRSANAGTYTQNASSGSAVVALTGSTGFRIEHQCSTTQATTGLGLGLGFGGVEVFTTVEIVKLA